ncbi:hypothetical protein ARAM_003671 [Aspergillus rambellii]|uniref:Major facilitator superfamily (MFS) profile domain-containing protein n=1 Tax=Aspergillus rambellii TaxID=308745 RepID=A0A0F8V1L7_9EURO|nr:hypothetical protein ARAM_003671 [Aspergillus rambellii]
MSSVGTVCGIIKPALDATSITTVLPTITNDLGGAAIQAFWSGTSFLVASVLFQPIFSLCSDIFGRKSALIVVVMFFMAGSVLAAVATIRCLACCFPEGRRWNHGPNGSSDRRFDPTPGTWALGSVVGPIVGGAFAESSSRWVFWINLPFYSLGLVSIPVFLRLHREKVSMRTKLTTIDYLGCGIFIASLSSFLVPSSLVGFAFYERFIPANPLIPPFIFCNRTIIINYLACFLHGALGYGAMISGLAVFPESFTVAPVSVMAGFAIAKSGKYRWTIWIGWVISTIGMGILSLLDANASIPKWLLLNLIPGLGLGPLFSAVMLAVQASANPEYLAMSVTLTAFFRTVGQAVGVAVGGVVFQNQIKKEFESNPLVSATANEFARDASGLVQYIKSLPEGDKKHALEGAYANALSVLWLVMCRISGIGFLTSLLIKRYTLCQAFTSQQGLKNLVESDVEGSRKASEAGSEKPPQVN